MMEVNAGWADTSHYLEAIKHLSHRFRNTVSAAPWATWLIMVQFLALFLLAILLIVASIVSFALW